LADGNWQRCSWKTVTIAGLLSGLAGVVTAARASTGQAGMGLGNELDAIAATIIGGTSLTGGIGRIWGAVIGMVILGLMTSGFTFLGVDGVLSGHRQGRDHRRGRCRRHVSPTQTQEGLKVAK
jgi:ribose/xylose/arabinose/galactoside ABC-type transport system permease subunit